ncbi:hypothetical protein MJO29_010127 [Puccinia striiformis f. sp. tritici]|nr:hypothetical protein MJO29_010127 [Puccinia striiformis f. sp. tritici]
MILGEYPSPARDTRSASRSRSDFLNIDHQRFADPSTTVRSTKQVIKDSINTDAINSNLARPAHLDHSSKINHPTDQTFLSDFLNHRKPI